MERTWAGKLETIEAFRLAADEGIVERLTPEQLRQILEANPCVACLWENRATSAMRCSGHTCPMNTAER